MSKTNDFYDLDGNLIGSEPVNEDDLQESNNQSNRAYLAETDWYVTRKSETGKAIPEDVLAKRETARSVIAEVKRG